MHKTLYFVRHAHSIENAEHRYYPDPSLTPLGLRQATYVAARLASIPFDAVIASTLERAAHTGRIIAEATGKAIEYSDALREYQHPSIFNGKSYDDHEVIAIRDLRIAHLGDPDWHHSDEENFFDLKARAEDALAELSERPEESLVVVTHATFLKTLVNLMVIGPEFSPSMFLNAYRHMQVGNTGITIIEVHDGEWTLIAWNDHAHLGDPSEDEPEEKDIE